jgi:hypothetical protein
MRARAKSKNERLFGRELLMAKWKHLNRDDLEVHLRFLVLAEHRAQPAHKHYDPTIPAYRWRARRKEVAKKFVALGGEVSPCVVSGALPPYRKWPGIVRLVKTNDFPLLGGVATSLPPNTSFERTREG